jgi:hypothetical protein
MVRLDYLKRRHRELDSEIQDLERVRPEFRTHGLEDLIHELKRRKLVIRDEIFGLEQQQPPE